VAADRVVMVLAARLHSPSYREAAPGSEAEPLYDRLCERLGAAKGVFDACMGVALVNNGPVTLPLEV
jgi:D-tyrosyl-tRNA(Tyr) deacylase